LHTSRQVYAEHVYNARCYSFCCLKWRHLVKFLPLDNAASKLEPNGRRLAHGQNERCVRGIVEPGAKINSQYYCEVLGQGLLPDIRTRCGRYKWTLQQDGAPSHTARSTVQYLQRENINFIEPNIMNMWPPNSPDLNPVDYAVWEVLQLQEMVYHRKTFTSVQELKRAIVTAWQQLSQLAFLDRSISEWRRRLENVVQCNGGHIEHVC